MLQDADGGLTCGQVPARLRTHPQLLGLPAPVQVSLAMTTMLSAGLCLAKAQQVTLLATGVRPPTLVLTR